jgi:hypothetical protein
MYIRRRWCTRMDLYRSCMTYYNYIDLWIELIWGLQSGREQGGGGDDHERALSYEPVE